MRGLRAHKALKAHTSTPRPLRRLKALRALGRFHSSYTPKQKEIFVVFPHRKPHLAILVRA
jgi:hypothetical protein